ncbi:MAG: hypothetical protein HY555_04595 [Euryarchaeota archaeon]|nr:hypothetical protein [Euryarchaeota archaeon]
MFEPTWRGRPLRVFRRAVMQELVELGMDLWDVVDILEGGFDCPRSPRREGVYERCVKRGRKTVKVVVEAGEEALPEKRISIWILRHVGEFGKLEGGDEER